ncbi:uncharacterized protein CCR75_000614 [Bremia lactucae]|uniref:Rab-GAP TBC domain-containing protein n=1 Tax=Bremia lactucae TaxID=4779 RepID=A0A976FDD3_BRELC|nr:hypothetical protein CCR75_000614 [Bremia lactucae]
MGIKKRHGNDRRRVRGLPGQVPAARERRHVRQKEIELRAVIVHLRALKRDGNVAAVEDLDECFREVRRLAITPYGLTSNEFRRSLWPFLLGHYTLASSSVEDPKAFEKTYVTDHRDAEQLEKDVERSLWHYDVVQGLKESERYAKRRALTQVILTVLSANDDLFYFQGYHDIVSVFLLTLGYSTSTFHAVETVSQTYQREPMRSGFEIVMATTRLLFPLLDAADEQLFQHLRASSVEPYFALPWIITWFSHQLTRFGDVARLYDVFLVTHPLFSLYVSAGVVLEAREKILRCERDFGTMHGMLSNLPQSMNLEKVIARGLVLFHQLPPQQLIQQYELDAAMRIDSPNLYFQFPYKYQLWPSVATPILKDIPPLPSRRTRPNKALFYTKLGSRQISVIVTTVAVGFVAIVSAYLLRDRLGLRI